MLGDIRQANQGECLFSSSQYFWGCTWTAVPGFGPSSAVRMLRCWRGFSKGLPRWSEACEEALKKLGLLSLAKRRLRRTVIATNSYWRGSEKRDSAKLFLLAAKSITRGNGHKFWPGRKNYTRKAVQHQSKLSSEGTESPPWRFSGLLQTNLQLTWSNDANNPTLSGRLN